MDTTENPRELSSAEQEQIQQWLAEAETASKAEDWDRTVALYRQALEFDRYLQGVEAKLQWAIRMRDTEGLYQQGKAKLEAGQYEEALIPLRKARLMYASHYKDIDDLIVQAQSALQKQKWEKRPLSRSAARKTQRQRNQRVALGILGGLVAIALIAILVGTIGPRLFSSQSAVPTSSAGVASTISPEQRNNMYKSAPEMQIDPNKNYRATIETSKGNIVVDLFPKDAPQHVNNFVFLARQGFYDNLTFHRVEKDPTPFVIQGGDPLGNGTGGPGYTIPPEIKRTHTAGALAMARRGGPAETTPSSGSQFYITLGAQPGLDGQYTVFGQTTPDSMSVVMQIAVGDVIKDITIQEQ
jgi:cyclophilin family peptidyl-prolyl cis-trans isomerase